MAIKRDTKLDLIVDCSCGLIDPHAHDAAQRDVVYFIEFPELTEEETALLFEHQIKRRTSKLTN